MQVLKNLSRNQKIVIGICLFFFIAAIIYSIGSLIAHAGKIKTVVKYAPYGATVTLNDARITNNSIAWLEPGEYSVKVEYNNHFDTHSETVVISEDSHAIVGVLNPLDSEGEEYISKHEREFYDTEGQVSAYLAQQGAKQKEKHPILNYLPINNSLYSISYEYDDNKNPIVNIKADPENLDVAVEKLKLLKNVNLLDVNLVFHTPTEFSSYQESAEEDQYEFIKIAFGLSDKYIINNGRSNGDYFYTSFYINDYDRALDYAHYRVILKKEKPGWSIAAAPQPLFTKYNTKNIPEKILKATNSY